MTDYPSITFPATFEGAGSIGADFQTVLKFKPDDALKVLSDLRGLPRGKYDLTLVSRQGSLEGDTIDREWSNMDLRAEEDGELVFEEHCLGGRCPHFAVATEGELEGAYVCGLEPEDPVKIVHGETPCPLGVTIDDLTEHEGQEADEEADEDEDDELDVDG